MTENKLDRLIEEMIIRFENEYSCETYDHIKEETLRELLQEVIPNIDHPLKSEIQKVIEKSDELQQLKDENNSLRKQQERYDRATDYGRVLSPCINIKIDEMKQENRQLKEKLEKYSNSISRFMALINILEDDDLENEDTMKLFNEANECFGEIYKEVLEKEYANL